MSDNRLVIKKYNENSAWFLASIVIEMAYASNKKAYGKRSYRRLKFKILKNVLTLQLQEQSFKQYTNDDVYLTFSPFIGDPDMEWLVSRFISYLDENDMGDIDRYNFIKKSLIEQLEKIKKVD